MNIVFKSLSLAVASLALSAQAQDRSPQDSSPWFAEVGYSAMSFTNKSETDGSKMKSNPGALTLAVGYRFHPNVAVEGLLGVGVTKGKTKWAGVDEGSRAKVDVYGIYVRPTFPINEQVELFGRLGYLQAKVSETNGAERASDSGGRFSYGLGVNYNVSKTAYLQATWTQGIYKKKDEPNLKGSAIGFAYGMRF